GRRQQAVLFQELVEGDAGDTNTEGAVDKVEQIGTAGLGVAKQELGDGPGIAGQEFAVRTTVQAMVGLLEGLLGGEPLLAGGRRPADVQQASELGDLEAALAVQQEMAEQARGVVVGALLLAEAEGGLQQRSLLGRQAPFGNPGLSQPVGKEF